MKCPICKEELEDVPPLPFITMLDASDVRCKNGHYFLKDMRGDNLINHSEGKIYSIIDGEYVETYKRITKPN